MLIESYSHPKWRDLRQKSEDTVLLQPGLMAVFDGATDAKGRSVNGITPGRLASESVATKCASLFANGANFDISAPELMRQLSGALASRIDELNYPGRPSTTMALVLYDDVTFRFIAVGDSGIRINGARVLRHCKSIDQVSAAARIEIFSILSRQHENLDRIEAEARRAIFLGLSESQINGWLRPADIKKVIDVTSAACNSLAPEAEIEAFLLVGIQKQHLFANRENHVFGYSALNGSQASMRDVIDLSLPVEEARSLEIFTDGYFQLPPDPTVQSWEESHRAAEQLDFHKIANFPNVKGSTSSEFSDDRSIIVMRQISGTSA